MDDTLIFRLVTYITMLLLAFCASSAWGEPKSNETDRASLIEFKSLVMDDPNKVFDSWNDTADFCQWPGITCDRRGSRVIGLVLPSSRLGGSLSPYIGNLSFLSVLDIKNNSFTGRIPQEIGKLRLLTFLGFENNSFSGQIPENISGCVNLRVIRLQNSMLTGEIPQGLSSLSGLRNFGIYGNNLTGNFPEFFGNFSSLEHIAGAYNNFSGTVPASLGRLQKLRVLLLGANSFSGIFPTSIFNITSLERIQFPVNQLEGSLPLDLGNNLPNLMDFNFGLNHLAGPVPPSIANLTKLRRLTIPQNNFSCSVPNLKNLNQLEWVSLTVNQLGNGSPDDLRFVESLNSTNLRVLGLGFNNFGGALPQAIGNLSSVLNTLTLQFNQFTGTIPSGIGDLRNLETLNVGQNQFRGSLPYEVGNLDKLKSLSAFNNRFTGEIPSSLGNLTRLTILTLLGNNFSGNIPSSLGNCRELIGLDLSRNNLIGSIPSEVLLLSSLTFVLFLSQNRLSGPLPNEIGNLVNLAGLYLHDNRLSGQVPDSLGRCTTLSELYLANNLFEGNITSFLKPLKALQFLDLSENNFSGRIPKFLENVKLVNLNLSFNHFEGEVPELGVFSNVSSFSVTGNGNICGGIFQLNLPSCPTTKLKHRQKVSIKAVSAIASGSIIFVIMILLSIMYIWISTNRKGMARHPQALTLNERFPQIGYGDILRMTDGLNHSNLIGVGSFSSVYKGYFENEGKLAAIKVLDLQTRAASKSFMAECEALRNIKHRNLIKIITACSTTDFQGNEFKALVYEYMENGCLEEWLHRNVAAEGVFEKLSLTQRLSIAIDVACAVEYLHHGCETPIIHCDLKPSNILLDVDMTAHVGDFGLARILCATKVSSVGVKGTIGYSPPEYGVGNEVSREGDVYSYGILLLEMFTGKRPTDIMFEGAWNIRSYCEAALPERAAEIADPSVFTDEFGEGSSIRAPRRVREFLAEVFEVGIGCCIELPGERMDIREAATRLRSIKASGTQNFQ